MEKQIAQIRNKMIGMIALIGLVSAWQHEFIAEGVTAHVYVTGSILAAFAFAIVMAFIFVSKLKNEVIAFNALKEMWDDIRIGPNEQASDPLWRHYRCSRPGRLFRRPRLLGHAYDLVTEELARTKKIRISVETMNTLVHKISQTIDDEKSLLGYMSGLLVFMGLIGTFIGLLHMVGSMGGIIGSLAGSADAAGPDAFQKLLGALQEPLKGMASGFAASLFGLFSSLVVGLLNRMAGQAAGVLKHEFESWLAGVVQIGDQEREDAMAPKVMAAEGQLNGSLIHATAGMLADYSKTASTFDDAVRLLQSLQARQEDHGKLMESVVQTLSQVGAGLEALTESVAKTVADELAATRSMVQDAARAHSGDLRSLAHGHADTSVQLAAAIEQNGQKAEQLSTQLSDNIEARIHHAVKEAIAPVGLTVADQMQRLEKAFAQYPQDKPAGRAFESRAVPERTEMVASH
jgi:polyhydroxyalkanoate synthesis regulator phasin